MDYQNILHNKSDYLDVYIKQGKVYQELGKSEEAIICYQNAIRINADYIEPHYKNILMANGDCKTNNYIETLNGILIIVALVLRQNTG